MPAPPPAWRPLALLYFGSGLAGLAYEVLWARLFGSEFGVSIFGVIVTVAAFMAGLALGSIAGARWTARLAGPPLRAFALLEIGVALYACALPWLAQALQRQLDALSAHLAPAPWFGVQALASFILLALPATAMGASFPIVLAAANGRPRAVGRLYGCNTLGAACGALVPLWSLPALGWSLSLRLAALAGLVVGACALWLSRAAPARAAKRQMHSTQPAPSRPAPRTLILYAGIGAASLMLEVGWTRLYAMVLLRTEYVLAVILCVYLLGLAFGSLLIGSARALRGLAVALPVIACAGALAGLFALPMLSARIEAAHFDSLASALTIEALALAALTLPTTLALGAWLPLLVAQPGNEHGGAWLYGCNSAGAALGAIGAGAILIPSVGSTGTVAMAALAVLVLGLAMASARRAWLVLPLAVLAALPASRFPPVARLLPGALGEAHELFRYEDAVSLNHVVQDPSGQRLLLTDLQRMDASTEPSAVQIQADQARLPLMLHPAPHRVLFLGLGTGISEAGSMPFAPLDRTAVELSIGSIRAARLWFAPVNGGITEHMRVVHDDARHFLTSGSELFDVIVGDLFHPDLAGASSLLTVEQFARVRARLAEDGLFVQWLTLNQFDPLSLQVVLRSFRSQFPDAQLFMDGLHLALVGRLHPAADRLAIGSSLLRLGAQQQDAATGGEGIWTWLGRYWGPIAASEGPLQHEWMPYIEFRLPRARYAGAIDLDELLDALLRQRPDAMDAARQLGVEPPDQDAFSQAYRATALATQAWAAALRGQSAEASRLNRAAYQANPHDRWVAHAVADDLLDAMPQVRQFGVDDRETLEHILAVSPDHVEALRALWHLARSSGHKREAEDYRSRLLAISPLDAEAVQAAPHS